jgi:hypothetical protein
MGWTLKTLRDRYTEIANTALRNRVFGILDLVAGSDNFLELKPNPKKGSHPTFEILGKAGQKIITIRGNENTTFGRITVWGNDPSHEDIVKLENRGLIECLEEKGLYHGI